MAFDVHVTFVGLCLFVDRGPENPMEVLLPATGAHAASPPDPHATSGGDCPCSVHGHAGAAPHADGTHGGTAHVHEHAAAVLYPTALEEEEAGEDPPELRRFDLKGGVLDLSGLATYNRHLHVYLRDVVDLTEVVKGRLADRDAAAGKVLIASGTSCPISLRPHFAGGRWKLGNRPRQHMSTRVHWIIPDVVETAGEDGEEGLALRILDAQGNVREALPTLRPFQNRIDLFVYHALEEEIPPFKANLASDDEIRPGDRAEHFEAFYALFPGVHPVVPAFVDRGTSNDPGGGEALLSAAAPLAASTAAAGKLACVVSAVREP
jgi:hypothetical protein